MSFPVARAQAAVVKVFAISVFLGHPRAVLLALLKKHARKFPVVNSTIFSKVRNCIDQGGPLGASSLVETAMELD